MSEDLFVRITQRIPPDLHAFAKEEAYRQRMSLNEYINSLIQQANRVGGGITPAVLPHHRTYGSVSGGSCEN